MEYTKLQEVGILSAIYTHLIYVFEIYLFIKNDINILSLFYNQTINNFKLE